MHEHRVRTIALAGLVLLTLPVTARSQAPAPDSATRLDSLAARAERQGTQAAQEQALQLWVQAVALHRRVGNRRSEGADLRRIGVMHYALGRIDSALVNFRLALDAARATGDRRIEMRALGNLGVVHQDSGRPDSAARKAFATISDTASGASISALNLVMGRNRLTVSML